VCSNSFTTLPAAQGALYSPLWDVAQGPNPAQTDANQIRQLAARSLVTSTGGSRLASDRSILDRPAIGFLTTPPTADQAADSPPIP